MTIGVQTTVSVLVTKNSDGTMNIVSGDAGATGWALVRPSYAADQVDDYTSLKNQIWNEIQRQIRNI
jgi:hypothetical protein